MARSDPTIYMRIPEELKEKLDAAALANKRSLTAEVVARLDQSFSTATIVASETLDLEKRAIEVRLETLATHRYMVTMHVDLLTQQLAAAGVKPEAKAIQDKIAAAKAELEKLNAQQEVLKGQWIPLEEQHQAIYRKRSNEMDEIIDVRLQKEYQALADLEEDLGVPEEKRLIKLVPKPSKSDAKQT